MKMWKMFGFLAAGLAVALTSSHALAQATFAEAEAAYNDAYNEWYFDWFGIGNPPLPSTGYTPCRTEEGAVQTSFDELVAEYEAYLVAGGQPDSTMESWLYSIGQKLYWTDVYLDHCQTYGLNGYDDIDEAGVQLYQTGNFDSSISHSIECARWMGEAVGALPEYRSVVPNGPFPTTEFDFDEALSEAYFEYLAPARSELNALWDYWLTV